MFITTIHILAYLLQSFFPEYLCLCTRGRKVGGEPLGNKKIQCFIVPPLDLQK